MTRLYNMFCILTTLCSIKGRGESTIVFPEDVSSKRESREIPLSTAKEWSQITDMNEFLDRFVEPDPKASLPILAARFGGIGASSERRRIKSAKMASCTPELEVVSLQPSTDTHSLYIPSCTRVKRCGGCCLHDLLSCQPVESEILQLGVVIAEYQGGERLKKRRSDIVSIEQHTKCKCDCRIKETDCSPYQSYNKDTCRCTCTNTDKEEKCKHEISSKLWDPTECACICREQMDCSTGFYFDKYTCRCIEEPSRRGNDTPGFLNRFNYNIDPF